MDAGFWGLGSLGVSDCDSGPIPDELSREKCLSHCMKSAFLKSILLLQMSELNFSKGNAKRALSARAPTVYAEAEAVNSL